MEQTLLMIKRVIEKDGGTIYDINVYDDTLIISAGLNSEPQLLRFIKVGADIGMLKDGGVVRTTGDEKLLMRAELLRGSK